MHTLPGAVCAHCGHNSIRVEHRLEAVQPGTYSLAGAQAKFAAREWLWAVCNGCGDESRGQTVITRRRASASTAVRDEEGDK